MQERPMWVRRFRRASVLPFLAAVFLSLQAVPSAAIETAARHAILIDATTGRVLFEKAADEQMPPASMSKIMTGYVVFTRLKSGNLKLEDDLPITEYAWRAGGAASGGSTMFLKLGDRVKVEDLLRGMIIQSGNDASIALAEGLGGSEAAFAEEMNRIGKQIGLQSSSFRNSTGLPDPNHYMTARDLSILARQLITNFPEYYKLYSEKEFVFNGIKQGNRNPLLYKNIGADGLKTGHTKESGYGLTASAVQDGRRLILVVNGLPSMQARADETERLMDYGFHEFNNYVLFKPDEPVFNAEVWMGEQPTVPLLAENGAVVTLPRKSRPQMKVTIAFDGPIPAPVARGQRVGTLTVTAPGEAPAEFPLVAGADVPRLGIFGRVAEAFSQFVRGIIG